MARQARQLVAPLYLFLCLILGGSAQGIWANMVLQLLGVAIIAWAAVSRPSEPLAPAARQFLWFAIVAIVVVVIQLIPLPSAIWPGLGNRQWIADDYRLLGQSVPALPVSLTPYNATGALLAGIPALAVFCAIVRLKAFRGSYMAVAVVAGALAGILVGALQVAGSASGSSSWYFYRQTNVGSAVGFFANANHMAILLVATIPFLAALVAAAKGKNIQRYSAFAAMALGMVVVVLVGIALNRSMAGYGLALPIAAASALILLPQGSPVRRGVAIASALLLAGAIVLLATSSIRGQSFAQEAASSAQSRQEILGTTTAAIKDHFLLGSGLGSFRQVYQLYEDPDTVTTTYVVHAHNDYAEIALELGLAGIILVLLFLIWWGRTLWLAWLTPEAGPFARAASIASAAILAHSLVDFPLRTAAVSAVFGMCLALLADRRAPQASDPDDLRPTRHVVVR